MGAAGALAALGAAFTAFGAAAFGAAFTAFGAAFATLGAAGALAALAGAALAGAAAFFDAAGAFAMDRPCVPSNGERTLAEDSGNCKAATGRKRLFQAVFCRFNRFSSISSSE
ncbi:hypothetical protein [Parapedomonas caeni]